MNIGKPSIRKRHKIIVNEETGEPETLRYTKSIIRPKVIQQYFEYFSALDNNNQLRQGTLAFHLHWPTRKWWHRLFSTILGVIITDAYYMYTYTVSQYEEETNIMTYIRFVDI